MQSRLRAIAPPIRAPGLARRVGWTTWRYARGSTQLADTCLRIGLAALRRVRPTLRPRARADGSGRAGRSSASASWAAVNQFLVGRDLVYAIRRKAKAMARSLAAEDYFARLGQQRRSCSTKRRRRLLASRRPSLAPVGNAARVALPFAAMESYFHREGRDWERYACRRRAPSRRRGRGPRFLDALRPSCIGAISTTGAGCLREMKASIAAEVARKELATTSSAARAAFAKSSSSCRRCS